MERVNMRELALKLGVDRSTVSRALSLDKSHLVGPETRDRVRKAAEEAGYRPNLTAASLRKGRTNTIGILVPDLGNEIFVTVIRHFVNAFAEDRAAAVTPLIAETRDQAGMTRTVLDTFLSRRVDAILSLAASEPDVPDLVAASRDVPVVLAIRKVIGADLPTAVCDDEAGAAMVAEHFAARGYERVCQIQGPTAAPTFVDRARGFSEACRRLGLEEVLPCTVAPTATTGAGRQAAAFVLAEERRPRAVFAHNDALALGLLETIRAQDLSCPADVAVVGFNNTHIAQLLATPLSSVDYPAVPVSVHAARTMQAMIKDHAAPWSSAVFTPRLVVRTSS
jgi:LacI family transcriptional regulator